MPIRTYPINLQPDDNGTLLVTSDDFPELTTFGENEAEAIVHAADALEVMVAQYLRRGLPIPTPSPARGRPTVVVGCRRPISDSPGRLR
jgi:antitoxin HicB